VLCQLNNDCIFWVGFLKGYGCGYVSSQKSSSVVHRLKCVRRNRSQDTEFVQTIHDTWPKPKPRNDEHKDLIL
jgi:hypothetical protein